MHSPHPLGVSACQVVVHCDNCGQERLRGEGGEGGKDNEVRGEKGERWRRWVKESRVGGQEMGGMAALEYNWCSRTRARAMDNERHDAS